MYYGEDPPIGLDIDHINRDKTDNRISNIRAVTHRENLSNRKRNTGNFKAIVVRLPDGQEKQFSSLKEAAAVLNLNASNLCSVLRGKQKTTKGFTARYA
jgi:hypothetical protein